MKMLSQKDVDVPVGVKKGNENTYRKNWMTATRGTGRIMIFAGDQKIEHLNEDFYGEGISADDNTPEHLFTIASQADIGVFASQLGLISQYGKKYPKVPYLIKLNAKTNLVKTEQAEPVSRHFNTIEDVLAFRESSGLNIVAVGMTIYVGSEDEGTMLVESAQAVFKAQQAGLLSVIWSYPRGKAVSNEKDPRIVAGAAGVAVLARVLFGHTFRIEELLVFPLVLFRNGSLGRTGWFRFSYRDKVRMDLQTSQTLFAFIL